MIHSIKSIPKDYIFEDAGMYIGFGDMQKSELSDTFVSWRGLSGQDDTIEDICMARFLEKELGSIVELLDMDPKKYFSQFIPLFFHEKKLYVIGLTSHDILREKNITFNDINNYEKYWNLKHSLTDDHETYKKAAFEELECGRLIFIRAKKDLEDE